MSAQERNPNVVFVLTDDQGYGELGCHGNGVIQTPNIDTHHADGVRFTDFHVGTTCSPTRAGLLTGHYCNSAGVWHTDGGRSLLREDEWTLANAFKGAGYRTAHFGKWHLGDNHPFRPYERGFEKSISHANGSIGGTSDPWGNDYFDDTYFVNGIAQKFEGYCTDVFFDEGIKWMEEHSQEPCFCYIATNAPHGPLNVEQRYIDMYTDSTPHEERARFYGMITNIDENFGRLQVTLARLGIAEDTILIFMTDNGTATGVELDSDDFPLEGKGSFNSGMRGKKCSPYEGGHRVPFLIRFPAGEITGGRDIDTLTSYVDFMPTLLDLCSIPVPTGRTFHGKSLVPLIEGEHSAEWDERIIVSDTQRIARPMKWRKSSIMRAKWRLINGQELYDISRDPGQRTDVAAEKFDVVDELRSGYDKWWDIVSEQFDRDIPIVLGKDDETVKLTAHDIRNEDSDTVWNQAQVRMAHIVSGYWEVDVRRAGRYRIDMRRWPEDAGHAVAEGIDGDDVEWRPDCIQEQSYSQYTGGVALNIGWAQLTIGGKTYQQEVDPESTGAVFEVDLGAGHDKLFSAFYDTAEKRVIAPYYIYIQHKENKNA